METPALERTFRGHKSAVTGVSFHPLHTQQLASGGADGVVMVWNFRPQLRAFRFAGHGGPVLDVCFSPQGELLASASQDRTVRLWTPSVRGDSVAIKAHAGAVRSVSFSACGKELLTASDDRSVKVWALPTRRFQCSLTGHSNWVRCARFSPDGARVASASDDKTVKLWDKERRVCVQTFYEHAGIVASVQFHPRDGAHTLASGSFDRSINVWDARAARLVQHYKAHDAGVASVHFHPSGNYLVSASLDSTLKIWDVREGQVLYTLHGHDGPVNCAEFSHDGNLVGSGAGDAFVMVWQAELDKYLHVDAPQVVAASGRAAAPSTKPPRISTTPGAVAGAVAASTSSSVSPVRNGDSGAAAGRPASPRVAFSLSPPPTPIEAPTPTQKPQHPGATASLYDRRPPSGPFASVGDSELADASERAPPLLSSSSSSSSTAATLQHIVGQLEIITRTLTVLEERISLNEDRIADVAKVQKELLQRQRQQQQHARRAFESYPAPFRDFPTSMSAWEEAFDAASQRTYYFNRDTGETSWTPPGELTSALGANSSADSGVWQQAFDEASQTAYYYNVHTGETSWTLPETVAAAAEEEADLSYLVFAVVRLQSVFRGTRERRRVARLVKTLYRVSRDPVTEQTLYTNLASNTSSWAKPALFTTLGIGDNDSDDGGDDDDADFDAFRFKAEQDDGDDDADDTNNVDNSDDGSDDASTGIGAKKKRRRRLPRSKAQARVDEAEDAGKDGAELDLSALNAWKLSSRIWNLQYLRTLVLSKNQLSRIPSGIQDLIHLEELDVSFNLLTRLPSCLQTTATLTALNASNNRIQSFSPKLWKLRALRRLDLSHNRLAELPYVEGDLKLLRETREWQVGVGLLTELRSLMLNHNMLRELPRSIDRCAALEFLNVSNNNIGVLSDEIGDLESLQCLYLHKNALAALPDSLGGLRRLEILELKDNVLASVPESAGNLQSLQQLGLARNQLRHLPEALGALSRLSRLELDGNPNLVALGAFFRRLPGVRVFSANACGLVRFETLEFLLESPVRALQASRNTLAAFPVLLAQSMMKDTLEELVLHSNALAHFPLEVARCCVELRTLDVSDNQLRSLPPEIGRLENLETLLLGRNALEELPDELALLAQLRELRCDHNRLRALPLGLGRLAQLAHVDVSFNRLETLPTSMAALPALESIYANDNRLTARPPVLRGMASCYCDFSNNPFNDASNNAVAARRRQLAEAAALMAAARFEPAEALLSAALDTLDAQPHEAQRKQRPQLRFARGLCRVMLLQRAQDDVAGASTTLDACECVFRERTLLRARRMISGQKTRENDTQRRQCYQQQQRQQQGGGDNNARDDTLEELSVSKPLTVAAGTANESALRFGDAPEVDDGSDTDDSSAQRAKSSSFLDAAAMRAAARAKQLAFAKGALADLALAIQLETAELPTARYLEGSAHMALMQFDRAIGSFTEALTLLIPRDSGANDTNEPTAVDATRFLAFRDQANYLLAGPVPTAAVHIFFKRAEAYRLLGQLPSALIDIRHVLAHHPVASFTHELEARERAYAQEWDAQQTEYFVDRVSLFRSCDVAARSGLPRRPMVRDLHRPMALEDVQKARNAAAANAPPATPLRPAERFAAEAARLAAELKATDAAERARLDSKIDARRRVLTQTRDFSREIRENLELEMEEARQRAVEQELARRAQLRLEELARELNEQLFMQYEDELTQWLAAEQARLEAERLWRLEEAQRRADAKAAYATRLARRGGRRQQRAGDTQTRKLPSRK
ncbi:hypothetical protein PybrP1_012569 [[Pythium] brassicae (nom. inval.)]|nr:hypothetical protein PybrP1_012569 [[Pythium] brassicae (nom. inval.)]